MENERRPPLAPRWRYLSLLALAICWCQFACSKKQASEHRSTGPEPLGTYRRALQSADSIAARAGRRNQGLDSILTPDR